MLVAVEVDAVDPGVVAAFADGGAVGHGAGDTTGGIHHPNRNRYLASTARSHLVLRRTGAGSVIVTVSPVTESYECRWCHCSPRLVSIT